MYNCVQYNYCGVIQWNFTIPITNGDKKSYLNNNPKGRLGLCVPFVFNTLTWSVWVYLSSDWDSDSPL